jgi:hypothetical protein
MRMRSYAMVRVFAALGTLYGTTESGGQIGTWRRQRNRLFAHAERGQDALHVPTVGAQAPNVNGVTLICSPMRRAERAPARSRRRGRGASCRA